MFSNFKRFTHGKYVYYSKNYGSSDQLTFIGHSGSSHSVFYLYRAISVGLSFTPR